MQGKLSVLIVNGMAGIGAAVKLDNGICSLWVFFVVRIKIINQIICNFSLSLVSPLGANNSCNRHFFLPCLAPNLTVGRALPRRSPKDEGGL